MTTIFGKIEEYVMSLDWMFIFTFILIAYIFSKDKALTVWWKESKSKTLNKVREVVLKVPKTIRIMILGIAYIYLLKLWRSDVEGFESYTTEVMFQSFLFAVAFHGLMLKQIGKWFSNFMGVSKNEAGK